MHQALSYGAQWAIGKVRLPWVGRANELAYYETILQVSLPCQVKVLVPSACGGPDYLPSPTPSHSRTLSICEVTEVHGPKACGQGCWPISNPRTEELLKRTRCIRNRNTPTADPQGQDEGQEVFQEVTLGHPGGQGSPRPGLGAIHAARPPWSLAGHCFWCWFFAQVRQASRTAFSVS